MIYFDVNTKAFVHSELLGFAPDARPNLEAIGLFPVIGNHIPEHDSRISDCVYSGVEETSGEYYRKYTVVYFSIAELADRLVANYGQKMSEFAPIFSALDLKRSRPMASITEAQALGQTPDPADVDRLGQLNMIVEENRAILAELKSTAIPTGATLEQAQAIVIAAAEVKPWLPTGYEELAHV